MIKKISTYLLLFLLFPYALLVFIPKANFYYLAQEEMLKNNLIINSKSIENQYFGLELRDNDVFFNSIKIANFSSLEIKTYLLKTEVAVVNINIDESMEKFLPAKISSVTMNHNIINPLIINIDMVINDSDAYAVFNIMENVITVYLKPNAKFKRQYTSILNKMTITKEGGYEFEYKL
jgi:hypothetical protein